jgi:Undecaprenyl-phosphate glucose phosphotransferase
MRSSGNPRRAPDETAMQTTATLTVPVATTDDVRASPAPIRTWSRRVVRDTVQMVMGLGALVAVAMLTVDFDRHAITPTHLCYLAVLLAALTSVRLVPHRAPWLEPSAVSALPSIARGMLIAGGALGMATALFKFAAPLLGGGTETLAGLSPWRTAGAAALGAGLAKSLCGVVLAHNAVAGRLRRNIAIYGASQIGRRLYREIAAQSDLRFIGLFDDRRSEERLDDIGLAQSGGLKDLVSLIRDDKVDAVAIALPPEAHERIADVSFKLQEYPVDVHLTLASPEASLAGADGVGDLTLVVTHRRAMRDWARILKAIEDRVLGSVLLVLSAPLFALIALAIKLDSKGPVFFRQTRHGRAGKPFAVWKFRSMRVLENGAEVKQATKGDPRVTRVGRWLRLTSLDELPQLLNVVAGDMSLVGPRPHAVSHNAHYAALIEAYLARHQVKPGMTGLAQINGFRGETQTPDLMAQRVALDLAYISRWSLWLDLKILALTPIYGLVHRNAY